MRFHEANVVQPLDLNLPNDDYKHALDTEKFIVDAPRITNLPENCDKFRILVIGKAGVGKSTICSAIFNIPPEQAGVSHRTVGTAKSQVWVECISEHNPNIILHDSGGFEAGDADWLKEVKAFIDDRRTKTKLADQLHCIWYCISCDTKRPIESSEKKFFREVDVGKIPVVVVFTQFDLLVDRHYRREEKQLRRKGEHIDYEWLDRFAATSANSDYYDNYKGQFEKEFGRGINIVRVGIPEQPVEITPDNQSWTAGLTGLLEETEEELTGGALKTLWAAAQWHSADMKLRGSLEVGMSEFWRAVGFGSVPFIPFVGATALYRAFLTILHGVAVVWGIPNCQQLTKLSKVRNLFLEGCFDENSAIILGAKFLTAINFLGPLTAGQTASMILKMIAGVTLIYEQIFKRRMENPRLVITAEVIADVVKKWRKDRRQRAMAACLTVRVGVNNCYSKKDCRAMLEEAIAQGRSSEGTDLIRSQTVVGTA